MNRHSLGDVTLGNILQRKYRLAYLLLGLWIVVAGTYLRASGWVYGEWGWFIEAAHRITDGSLAIYEHLGAQWAAPPYGVAYGYPPLYALFTAPFAALAEFLQWSDERAAMLLAAALLATTGLALFASSALLRWLRPDRSELVIFIPLVWLLVFGKLFDIAAHLTHQESLMLLFWVLGLRLLPGRPFWAGLALGLAFQAKQTMILPLLPVAGVLLVAAVRQPLGRRIAWRAALGAFLGAVPLLVIFYWAQPDQMRYALLTAESRRILYGPTSWGYLDDFLPEEMASRLLLALANPVLLGVVVIVIGFLIWRRQPALHSSSMYALVALASWLQILLGKWIEYHYYALPLALLLLWELRLNPRWLPWLSMSMMLTVFALYIEPIRPFHGVALQSFTLLAVLVLVAHVWLSAGERKQCPRLAR